MGKIIGIDLGTTNSCYGGRTADGYRQHGGRQDDSVCSSIYKGGGASGRRACKAPGSYKRGEDYFFY